MALRVVSNGVARTVTRTPIPRSENVRYGVLAAQAGKPMAANGDDGSPASGAGRFTFAAIMISLDAYENSRLWIMSSIDQVLEERDLNMSSVVDRRKQTTLSESFRIVSSMQDTLRALNEKLQKADPADAAAIGETIAKVAARANQALVIYAKVAELDLGEVSQMVFSEEPEVKDTAAELQTSGCYTDHAP